ncbi:MAG TPA: exodeoxyribonuclease VII large subunit [Candidatus Paceibacterota bacterium]
MANLRQTLYAWRDNEAAKRGVELFRVLPNNALDEIVRSLPHTKDELTAIKGIKEAKYREFGKILLAMVDEHALEAPKDSVLENMGAKKGNVPTKGEETVFTVSAYLDVVNRELYRLHARIRGEIIQFKIQGNALYATLKDTEDSSSLSLFMWMRDYELSGVALVEGMEVVVEGRSEVYKPSGRFNFRAETIELVGEGALKKAYDTLKKKLDAEGLFASEKKRVITEYPERIGLVTSKTGAVINDFLSNLGKFGYHITFVDSRVEGASATKEILRAIDYFRNKDIDVLVMIRGGGGSLELLQTFNNENVIRAIAEFPKPTLVAIGHDKDMPLAQLAADHGPSTPSLCATALNASWEEGLHSVRYFTKDIMNLYHEQLWTKKDQLQGLREEMRVAFARITALLSVVSQEFFDMFIRTQRALTRSTEELRALHERLLTQFRRALENVARTLAEVSRVFTRENPLRQLRLGYSILSREGKIVRGVEGLHIGEHFEARLSDGTLKAKIEEVNEK